MEKEIFDEWAILELMGHRRLAGRVTESAILGGALLRIDIPGKDGKIESTQFYGPASIYCLTPTTEEIARAVAAQSRPEPVARWEIRQIVAPERTCRICGCTENNPCITPPDGPCHWIASDICSACAGVATDDDPDF